MLNLPHDQNEKLRLLTAFHRSKDTPEVKIILDFLAKELAETDKKLRKAEGDYLLTAGIAQTLDRILELSESSSRLLKDIRATQS